MADRKQPGWVYAIWTEKGWDQVVVAEELPEPDGGMSAEEKGALLLRYMAEGWVVAIKKPAPPPNGFWLDPWIRLHFAGARLNGVSLIGARLRGAQLTDAHLEDASLNRSYLEEAVLSCSKLNRANLSYSRMDGVNLSGAHLKGANLFGAHLERANLQGVHLEEANLQGAHLERAKLSSARLDRAVLNDAHLVGANLSDAHLRGAYLTDAHLEGADLINAHLEETTLFEAHLEGTNFTDAFLKGADLSGADLEGAIFTGARLEKVKLTGAYIEGVNFWRAHIENVDLHSTIGTPKERRGARISAATYAKSEWNPATLREWLHAGAILTDFENLPTEAQEALNRDREGLTLHFSHPLTRNERLTAEILVAKALEPHLGTDCDVVGYGLQGEGSYLRLRSSSPEVLVEVAHFVYRSFQADSPPPQEAPSQIATADGELEVASLFRAAWRPIQRFLKKLIRMEMVQQSESINLEARLQALEDRLSEVEQRPTIQLGDGAVYIGDGNQNLAAVGTDAQTGDVAQESKE